MIKIIDKGYKYLLLQLSDFENIKGKNRNWKKGLS